MRSLGRAMRVFVGVLLGVSCFAQKVKIEYDHDVNFSGYRRYEWKEHPFLAKHPDSQQFSIGMGLVQSTANDLLMKRGFQPDDAQPEFYITQFITAHLGQEYHSVPTTAPYPNAYMWPGSWYNWSGMYFSSWETYVENYIQGILILDIVDAKTNKLLWRAACKDKIDDMKERHKDIEKTVKKALKSYPPEFKPKQGP
jgi:hypothetical protein